MKKLVTILLALSMVFSVAACGNTNTSEPAPEPEESVQPTPEPTPQSTPTPEPTETPAATPEPSEEPEVVSTPAPAPEPTPAPDPVPEPEPEPGTDAELSLQEIIDKMVEISGFDGGAFYETFPVTEEDAPFFTGYSDFSADFTEALGYGPMIGSIPFASVLFRLDEDADAQAFADDIKANANPAKWICVCADSVQTVVAGNTVFFIMSKTEYADLLTAAFREVMGV